MNKEEKDEQKDEEKKMIEKEEKEGELPVASYARCKISRSPFEEEKARRKKEKKEVRNQQKKRERRCITCSQLCQVQDQRQSCSFQERHRSLAAEPERCLC